MSRFVGWRLMQHDWAHFVICVCFNAHSYNSSGCECYCEMVMVRRCKLIDCFVLKPICLLKLTSELGV
jgi:hypothetical protein